MELIGQINANLILMVNESVPEEDDKNNRKGYKKALLSNQEFINICVEIENQQL